MASVRAISLPQLKSAPGGRSTKEVDGRLVTLVFHNSASQQSGQVYAFDSQCFHMGGPLGDGDIEDLDGRACIRCPWHGRVVDLDSGHEVEALSDTLCHSSQAKQRVYKTVVDAHGWIWIDTDSTPLPSDKYNYCGTGVGKPGFGLQFSSQDTEMAAPLTPFAGIDRRALPPSPSNPNQARSQEQLQFRMVKTKAMGLRNASARMAVLNNSKPPPMADSAEAYNRRTLV